MRDRKILLVLGAGASHECKLPTGYMLKTHISSSLDIRFEDGYRMISGDRLIQDALVLAIHQQGGRDVNPLLHAARRISAAMPQALSIDNYIDAHQGDKQLELCGKLAIVRAILRAEQQSLMHVHLRGSREQLDYEALEPTWLTAFFQMLAENRRIDQLAERLQDIGLVIFNYDRCVEHYLFYAFQNYYSIDADRAASLVRKIAIFHPYGTAGTLPWYGGHHTAPFGHEPNASLLLTLAGQIRTFTEGTDPSSSEIDAIRLRLAKSHIVVFLGFAYHRLNLALLRSDKHYHDQPMEVRYLGTAKGISQSDVDTISTELTSVASVHASRVTLRRDLTCAELLREYWRTLSLS